MNWRMKRKGGAVAVLIPKNHDRVECRRRRNDGHVSLAGPPIAEAMLTDDDKWQIVHPDPEHGRVFNYLGEAANWMIDLVVQVHQGIKREEAEAIAVEAERHRRKQYRDALLNAIGVPYEGTSS